MSESARQLRLKGYKPAHSPSPKGYLMADTSKQKFMALFLIPTAVIDDWAKTDPAIREPAEAKMKDEWGTWMGQHGHMILSTEAAGKTRRVTADGIADTRNDI